MKGKVLTFVFGVIFGLILSLWWRAAQINHLREHQCGPEYDYEVISGTLPE